MNSRSAVPLTVLFLLGGLASPRGVAQCPPIEEIVASSQPLRFVHSTSMDGDRFVCGQASGSFNGVSSGVATVFRHDGTGWVEEALVGPSDGSASDSFGWETSLCGEVMAIAAIREDDEGTDAGAVYVYRHDGTSWVQEAKLTRPGTSLYGEWIACTEEVILVSTGTRKVDVWRYAGRFVGWQNEASFGSGSTPWYGSALAIEGDTAIIGSYHDSPHGVVYVHEYDGNSWSLAQTLQGSDTTSGEQFGRQLDFDGTTLCAFDGSEKSLYFFERSGGGFVETQRVLPTTSVSQFGSSLAVDGDSVIVGRRPVLEFRRGKQGWVEATVYGDGANDLDTEVQVADGRAILGDSDRVYEFPATRLRLVGDNLQPAPGESLRLRSIPGPVGAPLFLFAMEVDGAPFRVQLLSFQFGPNFFFDLNATIPSGLTGLDVGLQTFALTSGGVVQESNLLVLDFQ